MKWALILVLLAGLNSTFGNLLLKASRQTVDSNSNLFEQYMSLYFMGAMIFYGINVMFFAKALDYLPVNIGYPILASSGFAMLAFSSWAIYDEKLGLFQIIGLIIVVIGIAMLSLSISN